MPVISSCRQYGWGPPQWGLGQEWGWGPPFFLSAPPVLTVWMLFRVRQMLRPKSQGSSWHLCRP